ncbi:hypothetical protein JYU34_003451 [Plutella xylostella]|uniref:Uncharacterized protein n=1 Tax=Plutella xylostella TaxID=51655 RepID=A0ABQ7R027_PLUXY|nr:hypothetical protein JYU34_003451 [Plutella xylostella]
MNCSAEDEEWTETGNGADTGDDPEDMESADEHDEEEPRDKEAGDGNLEEDGQKDFEGAEQILEGDLKKEADPYEDMPAVLASSSPALERPCCHCCLSAETQAFERHRWLTEMSESRCSRRGVLRKCIQCGGESPGEGAAGAGGAELEVGRAGESPGTARRGALSCSLTTRARLTANTSYRLYCCA